MELMFSFYILGQYLTLISHKKCDVISWVEEEHEIITDKGFLKDNGFFTVLETEEAANTGCSNKHSY